MYVHPSIRGSLRPNVIGWRTDREWRNVDSLHHGAPRLAETAEKYEGGMLSFPSLYAMKASLQLIEELGMNEIERRVLQLASLVRCGLQALSATFVPPCGAHLESQVVAARLKDIDSSELARALQQRNILVAARKDYLRISPHFYNNEDDVANFIDAVRALIR